MLMKMVFVIVIAKMMKNTANKYFLLKGSIRNSKCCGFFGNALSLFFLEKMEPEKFQNIKKEQINKEKLIAMISNIVTHTIYLFLLIALATTLNGENTYYQKEQTERLVKVIMKEIIVKKYLIP